MRKRFSFISSPAKEERGALMPFLPLILNCGHHEVKTYGMLDTGSMVNVLPFSVGLSQVYR